MEQLIEFVFDILTPAAMSFLLIVVLLGPRHIFLHWLLSIAVATLYWCLSEEIIMHLSYLRYVLKHKWFVFYAGVRLILATRARRSAQYAVPVMPLLWRLLIHDLSKFSWIEWRGYTRRFYGACPKCAACRFDFAEAWRHHKWYNDHHWDHWSAGKDASDHVEMPPIAVLEMMADWIGAGRGIVGNWSNVKNWYSSEQARMHMHSKTLDLVAFLFYHVVTDRFLESL